MPDSSATPRHTVIDVLTRRRAWARREVSVIRHMSGCQRLQPVEHALGRRVVHGADDSPVGKEQHMVGVPGGNGIMRDHHD